MTASGTTSDKEWQRVTTSNKEWHRVIQRVTTNGNEWERVTTVVQRMNGTVHFKEWMIAILSMTKIDTLLFQGMDGCS